VLKLSSELGGKGECGGSQSFQMDLPRSFAKSVPFVKKFKICQLLVNLSCALPFLV
jgi:hypothetical protein